MNALQVIKASSAHVMGMLYHYGQDEQLCIHVDRRVQESAGAFNGWAMVMLSMATNLDDWLKQ